MSCSQRAHDIQGNCGIAANDTTYPEPTSNCRILAQISSGSPIRPGPTVPQLNPPPTSGNGTPGEPTLI